nr:MAG TPA: hypothetical protein [Caudoviricetes sp.]
MKTKQHRYVQHLVRYMGKVHYLLQMYLNIHNL